MALHGRAGKKTKKDSARLLASEWRTRKRRRSRAIVHVGKPSKREEAFTRLGVSHGNPLSWISSKDFSLSLSLDFMSLHSRRGNWLARKRALLSRLRVKARRVSQTRDTSLIRLRLEAKAWQLSLSLSPFPHSLRLWECNSIKTRD